MTSVFQDTIRLLNWLESVVMVMSRVMEVRGFHIRSFYLVFYIEITVENRFFKGLKMIFRHLRRHKIPVHSLGPVSKNTLEKYGLPLTLEGVPRQVQVILNVFF